MSDLALDTTDTGARYQRIADVLRREIGEGRWPVGTRLPTEQALCERFGVSRFTVRQALGALVELGLVDRRQGSGSQVRALEPERRFVNSITSIEDLMQYAEASRLEVFDRGPADRQSSGLMALAGEDFTGWTRVEGVRFAAGPGGAPVAWAEILLPPRFAEFAGRLGRDRRPIHRVIAEETGIEVQRIEQTIEAVDLAPEQAAALDLPGPRPALALTRCYLSGADEPMLVAVNLHPSQRFAYRMQLGRAGGGSR